MSTEWKIVTGKEQKLMSSCYWSGMFLKSLYYENGRALTVLKSQRDNKKAQKKNMLMYLQTIVDFIGGRLPEKW